MGTEMMTLREARRRAGLGRVKCARLAGIDAPSLGRYEAGQVVPGLVRALRIAKVLGVEIGEVKEFVPTVRDAEAAGVVFEAEKAI